MKSRTRNVLAWVVVVLSILTVVPIVCIAVWLWLHELRGFFGVDLWCFNIAWWDWNCPGFELAYDKPYPSGLSLIVVRVGFRKPVVWCEWVGGSETVRG